MKKKKDILIDTILYNPTSYVFNLDYENMTGYVYNVVKSRVEKGTILKDKDGDYVLRVINKDDKRKKEYHHLKYMFDITEKVFNTYHVFYVPENEELAEFQTRKQSEEFIKDDIMLEDNKEITRDDYKIFVANH